MYEISAVIAGMVGWIAMRWSERCLINCEHLLLLVLYVVNIFSGGGSGYT